ncbi:MAG TPA: thiamine phosphate synthase [Methylophilaceae bacterium]
MLKNKQAAIHGLYAITPDMADTAQLCALVEASLLGGAALLQYRNKTASHALRVTQSRALLDLCREHGVPLIINDNIKLCLAIDADGVHLGTSDGNLAESRARLGPDKILGASCYNRYELAVEAKIRGADYVAFGACFASATKPNALKADLTLLNKARADLSLPAVAIGGITLDNAELAINAGADAVAVIAALYSAPDIKSTAQQFSKLFKQTSQYDLTQSTTI